MQVAILTDFVNHDPAYSLCSVVSNQITMLQTAGIPVKVLVRDDFHDATGRYDSVDIVRIGHGRPGDNRVHVDAQCAAEIDNLETQLASALDGVDVVLTHDLIYQPNLWKAHVAARRLAQKRPNLNWLHWVHSATDLGVARQIGRFAAELDGRFPNSKLVAMHREEMNRKGALAGYEIDQIAIIPNPVDFTADYDGDAANLIEANDLWGADVIAIFPCRLDRGKQPHILIEIMAGVRQAGLDGRVVIVDFHSVGDDKADYRRDMKAMARKKGVPIIFSSDMGGTAAYHLSHKAVMDLIEFADILIHPSMSESDPLTVIEAAWKRAGLVLNFDLPVHRHLYEGQALFGKFSSAIDVHTGMPGATTTGYGDRDAYMRQMANAIIYQMTNNPVLALHARMRKERSLRAVGRTLVAAVSGIAAEAQGVMPV